MGQKNGRCPFRNAVQRRMGIRPPSHIVLDSGDPQSRRHLCVRIAQHTDAGRPLQRRRNPIRIVIVVIPQAAPQPKAGLKRPQHPHERIDIRRVAIHEIPRQYDQVRLQLVDGGNDLGDAVQRDVGAPACRSAITAIRSGRPTLSSAESSASKWWN